MPQIEVAPKDLYNAELVSNAHPPDWKNPEPAPRYNLVVIGAGTAGLVSAAGAAAMGARVALVERLLMGGDCLNTGCVPSKCILRSSRAWAGVRDAARFGVSVPPGARVDFSAVMERMRRLRARISHHDSASRFQQLGADVFLGEARFTGLESVEVAGKTLRFKKAVIATGARAAVPRIEGLAEAGFLTNETVFNLTERPERLLVIGGGPIGSELAQAFCRLGSRVTIVEQTGHLLPREDSDAVEILAAALQRDGVDLKLNAAVRKVRRVAGEKRVELESGGRIEEVAVDEVLVAVGRAPNVEGLDLERAGVDYDPRQGVRVNDFLQTSNRRIYAAGDICLPYRFTHAAEAAAAIVVQNALFLGRKRFSALHVPWCTYTDPEIAHVGLHEKDAGPGGTPVRTFRVPLDGVDRAIADGEEEGFVKVHVRSGTDKIAGATIVASHAGEMINEISLAMTAGIGLGTIAGLIHPYPTQAEAIKRAAGAYNRSRLTPRIKKLSTRWLSWTR
ncbi:MAG: mercuric reductase [Acidobacteria bacterium]|nr:mercuric reductase [Acidobacteriota bacterium]